MTAGVQDQTGGQPSQAKQHAHACPVEHGI
jgi:hypothetical protein